ncbi:uracil-DNA glycosylase family protein [Frateuria aurantia]|uniref:Uracil-DNA glycosylase n=1 Tax=Frateuria aurantia (strain ATCC 33424 / DSM 6220 / KCTC 2777 / LMG 1558 / NBRC 3245 / NCIMB 13370) TaxID=767434 RepID=H8L614_FRAAD|nr:uracil-DNA glycosylase family protein [Frateuria aurantia]AFC86757.1 uracil-DNA glycosylase [Frateuria aurantia DSM 6220]
MTEPPSTDQHRVPSGTALDLLADKARRCRLCVEHPDHGRPLDHAPRPVFQVSATARICIAGQAPGIRAHHSGIPFSDPSGQRLRQWMGIDEMAFYDASRMAILPMGFCFPGFDDHGSDKPPRPECARTWHASMLAAMPEVKLLLLVGGYAQRWHLRRLQAPKALTRPGVNDTVRHWRDIHDDADIRPTCIPLPHPSWRNSGWLKRNPWFEAELLPVLRITITDLLR